MFPVKAEKSNKVPRQLLRSIHYTTGWKSPSPKTHVPLVHPAAINPLFAQSRDQNGASSISIRSRGSFKRTDQRQTRAFGEILEAPVHRHFLLTKHRPSLGIRDHARLRCDPPHILGIWYRPKRDGPIREDTSQNTQLARCSTLTSSVIRPLNVLHIITAFSHPSTGKNPNHKLTES